MFSRKLLIQEILTTFEEYYEKFIYSNELTNIIAEYRSMCLNIGKEVVIMGSKQLKGTAFGITEIGELIIKTETGEIINVSSGEVSLRGINNYI